MYVASPLNAVCVILATEFDVLKNVSRAAALEKSIVLCPLRSSLQLYRVRLLIGFGSV